MGPEGIGVKNREYGKFCRGYKLDSIGCQDMRNKRKSFSIFSLLSCISLNAGLWLLNKVGFKVGKDSGSYS